MRRPPLLEFVDARKEFASGLFGRRRHVALELLALAFDGEEATITTIAGESGSGKTTVARLALGLLTPTAGEVRFRGESLTALSGPRRLAFRREVQAVFQDPYDAYNPFYTVDHVFDSLIGRFRLASKARAARALVEDALAVVGLDPRETLGRHAFELSGGQAQRVMIARAFLLKPRLIVADEPVSMVDASLRGVILETMLRLKRGHGISFLYVTHDLSTARWVSDDILVLHEGRVVERGPAARVLDAPEHAYTRLLVASIPLPDPDRRWGSAVPRVEGEPAPVGAAP